MYMRDSIPAAKVEEPKAIAATKRANLFILSPSGSLRRGDSAGEANHFLQCAISRQVADQQINSLDARGLSRFVEPSHEVDILPM